MLDHLARLGALHVAEPQSDVDAARAHEGRVEPLRVVRRHYQDSVRRVDDPVEDVEDSGQVEPVAGWL